MRVSNFKTDYISSKKAIDLIKAADLALQLGTPLNWYVTINWDAILFYDRVQDASSVFTQRFGEWVQDRHLFSTWLYVVEHPPGKSIHQHYLFHLPEKDRADFRSRQFDWLRQAGAKFPEAKDGILGKAVGYPKYADNLGHYQNALEGLLRYFLKGAEPAFCDRLGIDHKFQGTIIGQRTSTSHSIGPTQRARAGKAIPSGALFPKFFGMEPRRTPNAA